MTEWVSTGGWRRRWGGERGEGEREEEALEERGGGGKGKGGGRQRRGEERGKKLSCCPIGPPRGALRLQQGAAGVVMRS